MVIQGVRRRWGFVRSHFIALCLAALVLILLVVSLAGCTTTRENAATSSGASSTSVPGASSTTAGERATSSSSAHRSRTYTAKPSSPSGRSRTARANDGLPTISADALPEQARRTLELIDAGGPFPYPRNDGVVYNNYNRVLPKAKRGYYHEYTVKTPGIGGRGPKRIVTGKNGEFYWTADHYDSFARIIR